MPDYSDVASRSIEPYCMNEVVCAAKRAPKRAKFFDQIEKSGTEVSYRCVDCRSCIKCKNGPHTEEINIQDANLN